MILTWRTTDEGGCLWGRKDHFYTVIAQGAIFFQISNGFRLERYSHILIWCGRIFIKGRTCNRKCRKECSFTKLVYPFNNEMIWFVILMHQKPFLSLKTSLFQVYGNIEIVEGYSSQIYSCGKQFNLLEEYSPLVPGDCLEDIKRSVLHNHRNKEI